MAVEEMPLVRNTKAQVAPSRQKSPAATRATFQGFWCPCTAPVPCKLQLFWVTTPKTTMLKRKMRPK